MFVRLKKNKSGSTSVQLISKCPDYHVVKSFGSTKDPQVLDALENSARLFLKELKYGSNLSFFQGSDFEKAVDQLQVASVRLIGPEIVFGRIFDDIGFSQIEDALFRQLVITRIVFPFSKLKTTRYLNDYFQKEIDVSKLYRFLDKLNDKYKEQITQITFNYTKKVLGGEIRIVFYDVTTLYYHASAEDDLRKVGFGKDGKFTKPKILLAFLVGSDGYPISYQIFNGKKYEGHTLIPTLQKFCAKFSLPNAVVVADSGMLSKKNLEALENEGFTYIVGAKLKNMTENQKKTVLMLRFKPGVPKELEIERKRLIVSHSEKRARKDAYNRERGLRKLKEKVKSGKLTKSTINNRGYNKYLEITGSASIKIDYEKPELDKEWDGLKGYFTNADKVTLSTEAVVSNYSELWKIEQAFRISKTDLRVRPIYHRLRRRIEAHISIAFTAYTILKELERRLKNSKTNISMHRAIELAKTITEVELQSKSNPLDKKRIRSRLTQDQKTLLSVVSRVSQ